MPVGVQLRNISDPIDCYAPIIGTVDASAAAVSGDADVRPGGAGRRSAWVGGGLANGSSPSKGRRRAASGGAVAARGMAMSGRAAPGRCAG